MHFKTNAGTRSAAAGLIGTGLAVAFPEQRWIGFIIIAVGFVIFIFDIKVIDWKISFGNPGAAHMNYWGPWVLIIAGPLIGVLWLYFTWAPSVSSQSTSLSPFSWRWQLIPDKTASLMAVKLSAIDKQPITVICDNDNCANLSSQLIAIFNAAHWPIAPSDGTMTWVYSNGLTGILITKADDYARGIADVFNDVAGIPTFVQSANRPGMPQTDHIMIVIGAKPAPTPLPENVLSQLDYIVEGCKRLSTEILDFSTARQQELSSMILTQTGSTPIEQRMAEFRIRGQFNETTEVLMTSRFGPRVNAKIAELKEIGISPTWSVASNVARDPGKVGQWFGTVAEQLAAGHIEQARTQAADEDFWFNK